MESSSGIILFMWLVVTGAVEGNWEDAIRNDTIHIKQHMMDLPLLRKLAPCGTKVINEETRFGPIALVMKKVAALCGMDESTFSPKSYRRGFAKDMRAKWGLEYTRQLLNHSSTEISTIYTGNDHTHIDARGGERRCEPDAVHGTPLPTNVEGLIDFMKPVIKECISLCCGICGQMCATVQERRRHQSKAHDPTLQCATCGYRAAKASGLREHVETHAAREDRIRHPCPVEGCNADFSRVSHLNVHVKTVHLAERPAPPPKKFPCRKENCTKGYSRAPERNAHERLCGEGERERVPCPLQCGKSFLKTKFADEHIQNGRCKRMG